MTKVTSKIRAGFTLTLNGADYYMEKGRDIDELRVHGPYSDEIVSGKLIGFSIRDRHSPNRDASIYDGIPTHMFVTDHMANIKDLELSSEIAHLMILAPVEPGQGAIEHEIVVTKVPVDRIVGITGTFTDPEGNVTMTVDLTDETVSISDLLAQADPEVTTSLVIGTGDIEESIQIAVDANVLGENASVPQNFDQNPEEEVA